MTHTNTVGGVYPVRRAKSIRFETPAIKKLNKPPQLPIKTYAGRGSKYTAVKRGTPPL